MKKRTRKHFYSVGEIVNDNSIGRVCKGKAKSAGKHPVTEEKLTWKYID